MRWIVFVVAALTLLFTTAFAQGDEEQVRQGIETRQAQLAEIEERLADDPGQRALIDLAEDVRQLRQDAALAEAPALRRLDELQAELTALGPAPAEGEPAESADLQAQRQALNRRIASAEAARAQIALNLAAAERIAAQIAELRREAFTDQLLSRAPFFFMPAQLQEAAAGFLEGAGSAATAYETWYAEHSEDESLDFAIGSIIVALILAAAMLIPVRSALNGLIARRIATLEPFPSRRVILAAVRTAARVLPGILGGFFVYEAMRLNGAIPEEGETLARAIWFGFITLLFADGVANAVFAPRLPAWRVFRLDTSSVLTIRALLITAAAVIVADRVLLRGAELFGGNVTLLQVQEAVVAIVLGVLLFLLSREGLWRRAEDDDTAASGRAKVVEGDAPPGAPEAPAVVVPPKQEQAEEPRAARQRIRTIMRVLAVTAVIAPVLGYINLGHFVATRTFALIALFGMVWALRALMREAVRLLDRRFSSQAKEDSEAEQLLFSWIGITIDVIALILFVPPALLVLGAAWADVRGWIVDAFIGFEIGSVRISFAKILTAIAIFAILLWLTRLAQKAADTQVFPRSRIDKGVQNSLRTLMGYIGLIIAFAAGVGTLGFDLSNLAIIAGALSVGIGFGLQSIVNNFVSGLILLFERPIKVGDWIITSSGEGIVKRISVRSTEIETFDRSSVIVPNSELISGAVTNWTHKDRIGRLIINVGASYGSDAARVIEVLEEVARESRDILNYPAPFVVFEDFGASSLDFSLRTYIRDVSDTLKIRTRLRVAIHQRFREEGIEIPFPQRDINMRDLPEDFFDRYANPRGGDGQA